MVTKLLENVFSLVNKAPINLHITQNNVKI